MIVRVMQNMGQIVMGEDMPAGGISPKERKTNQQTAKGDFLTFLETNKPR